MTRWSSPILSWALMAVVSAFLFVGFFLVNQLLFDFLEYVRGINWVFLPAGFRVLLVLVFDWPGALGIALGSFWLSREQVASVGLAPVVCIGLTSGFGPWLVKWWMQKRGLMQRELAGISSACLLQFVLAYAAINAAVHQLIFWGFSFHNSHPWVDIWPMFIGDLLGALMTLYLFKLSLPWLRGLGSQRL